MASGCAVLTGSLVDRWSSTILYFLNKAVVTREKRMR